MLIRADAGSRIGCGHVLRCLALGQAWRERGGQVEFVSASLPAELRRRLAAEGCSLTMLGPLVPGGDDDLRRTCGLLRDRRPQAVVVDGYSFGATYQLALRHTAGRLLVLDDHGYAERYESDLVLNQNPHACEGDYHGRLCRTRLLLGTRYVLLRREFFPWRRFFLRPDRPVRSILITFGGTDPHNVTGRVLRWFSQIGPPGLELRVVIGPGNPHRSSLLAAARGLPHRVQWLLSPAQLAFWMASADLAITAGGSTCWELAFLGVPLLVLVVADNQLPIARELGLTGGQIDLGRYEACTGSDLAEAVTWLAGDPARRRAMSLAGRQLVDGLGARRVADALRPAA